VDGQEKVLDAVKDDGVDTKVNSLLENTETKNTHTELEVDHDSAAMEVDLMETIEKSKTVCIIEEMTGSGDTSGTNVTCIIEEVVETYISTESMVACVSEEGVDMEVNVAALKMKELEDQPTVKKAKMQTE
jgi:hypothetical protein